MKLATMNQSLTMSSLDIAELLGKKHGDVLRDIREVLYQAKIDERKFATIYIDSMSREKPAFNLPRRECDLVISGYSVKYRLAIIDRWQELESKSQPQVPTNFIEAMQLALDQAKQLELAAPKVAFVDNLVDRTNLLTATQVGQKHKLTAIKLNKILTELDVYNGNVKRTKVFKQWFIEKGFGEIKKTELGYDQPLFTNAGEAWINERLISEGIV